MQLIKLSAKYLKSIAGESARLPKLYYHPIAIARDFFWLRLQVMINLAERYVREKQKCLDFACGSGVFLPTLSVMFKEVIGVDLEPMDAEHIVKDYHLSNVVLKQGDLNIMPLEHDFDAVFAADVLEHFPELNLPIRQIYTCLKPQGVLFTSLPTENAFTKLTRILGGYKKPEDHYYTGKES